MKVVRLTESQLYNIVKKVISEQNKNDDKIISAFEGLGFTKAACGNDAAEIGFEWCNVNKPHVIIQYRDGYLQLLNLKTMDKWPDEVYEIFTEDDLPDLEFNIKTML